jgi:hypothetical protein
MSERPIVTFVDCLVEAATSACVPLFHQLTGDHLMPQSAPDSDDARPFVASVETWGWPPVLADLGRGNPS